MKRANEKRRKVETEKNTRKKVFVSVIYTFEIMNLTDGHNLQFIQTQNIIVQLTFNNRMLQFN